MLWVGLTGGIGTGKSTASQIFCQKGIPILDADFYSHQALEQPKVAQKVLSYFGKKVIKAANPDTSDLSQSSSKILIDRQILRDIVFCHPHKKTILETILHPVIKTMVCQKKKQLEQLNTTLAIYEAPLLFEKNMQTEFDYVLLLAADKEIVYERLQKSRRLTKQMIDLIVNTQMPQKQKLKLTPYIIWNNGTIKDLETACHNLLTKILS